MKVVLKISYEKKTEKKLIQKRLQLKNTEMKMTSVNKVQFASLKTKDIIFQEELLFAIWSSIIIILERFLKMLSKNSHCH